MQAKMQSKAALEELDQSSNMAQKQVKPPPEKRPMNNNQPQQNILQKKIKVEKPDPIPPKRSPERSYQPPRTKSSEQPVPPMSNGSVKNLMKYDMLPIPKEIK